MSRALALAAILSAVGAALAAPASASPSTANSTCPSGVIFTESIPIGLELYPAMHTYETLIDMFNNAAKSIDIAAFYFTLTDGTVEEGAQPGIDVYNAILAAAKRGVVIRIAVNEVMDPDFPQTDVFNLVKAGAATAVFLNFSAISPGSGGILHTKFAIADNTTVYCGSANMDWRSMTQVKELGLYFRNCPAAAGDFVKVFSTYWMVGLAEAPPAQWPADLSPDFTATNPGYISLNSSVSSYFVSYSPPVIRPPGWTFDEVAITTHIGNAQSTVSIEVMDYVPAILYSTPPSYYGVLDDAIRGAAFRNITVQLLIGYWNYSIPTQVYYLQSLAALPNVEVRYFLVPDPPAPTPIVPYTRVNHAKWMVTDNAVYVGTSNWCGDYFTTTAGVGMSLAGNPTILAAAQDLFYRDWNSQYTVPLPQGPYHAL